MIAIDFGTGNALAIWGPQGKIEKKALALPRVKGGKSPRDEFRLILLALLQQDDVVVESPTIGSSGCEVADIVEIVKSCDHQLYTLSARAVKNYRMDNDIPTPKSYKKYETESDSTQDEVHVLDAEILYRIALDKPERLRAWRLSEPCERTHTSVRPYDKRLYRGVECDDYIKNLPEFTTLPDDIKAVLGANGAYNRSLAMPFAMALEEPYLHSGPEKEIRKRWQKLLGMHDHGYPSFYRRGVNTWMQRVATLQLGLKRYSRKAVTPEQRKSAWKTTQRQIRQLLHMSLG